MSMNIEMERWENGMGITLRMQHQYGGVKSVVSLDCADVERLQALLADYQSHPAKFCLPESCSIHRAGYAAPEPPEFPAYVDAQGNEHAEF